MGWVFVLFIKRLINCSRVFFGNFISFRSNGCLFICIVFLRIVFSVMVSFNFCCSFNLFKIFCCSSIASLNLIFCFSVTRLVFILIKVFFEERLDESDVDDSFEVLRDEFDRTDVILFFSIVFNLCNAVF